MDVADLTTIALRVLKNARSMGRVGKALRQVLETYDINQNQLAITMGIDRSRVSRWVNEQRDPSGDVIVEIKEGLKKLDPLAAKEFVKLYLGESEDF